MIFELSLFGFCVLRLTIGRIADDASEFVDNTGGDFERDEMALPFGFAMPVDDEEEEDDDA